MNPVAGIKTSPSPSRESQRHFPCLGQISSANCDYPTPCAGANNTLWPAILRSEYAKSSKMSIIGAYE